MTLRKRLSPQLSSLLIIFALLSGTHAPAATAAAAPQAQQRDRRAGAARATPAPTPSHTASPLPAASPAPSSVRPTPAAEQQQPLTPAAEASPLATPTPAPARVRAAPRTLEELRSRIQELSRQPSLASSRLAVKVASLDTGRVLYEEESNEWMQPASNMKLYTVAAALDRLGPDFRFVTSVYAPSRPDLAGTVRGDLTVYGRGDPTYATRFNNPSAPAGTNGAPVGAAQPTDYYRAIDELAARVVSAGVRRVEGDLVGDESYFTGDALPPGWAWDDLQWYYGAEVSALSVNDNAVDLSVRPGERVGDPCRISVGPQTPLVTVIDRTKTSPRGTKRELTVRRALNEDVVEVSGTMPLDDRPYTGAVAVARPALLFASMLRESLERQGVQITGRTRTVDARAREAAPLQVSSLVEIAVRQSPPLSLVAAQTMKPSQNLYTELILRALGRAAATDPKLEADEAGIKAVRDFAAAAGIDTGKLVIMDGSGLSRANLITAETTVQLLVHMSRHRHGAAFRNSLPVAGVDGTLRNRMRNTVAAGNVRAKTGTLGTSTTLSGYVLSAGGERLAFSLMVNNPPRESDARALFTEPVAVLLASFAGHS